MDVEGRNIAIPEDWEETLTGRQKEALKRLQKQGFIIQKRIV